MVEVAPTSVNKRPSLVGGEIYISLTVEASKRFTAKAFTAENFSKYFGIAVEWVSAPVWRNAKDENGKETGEQYQYVKIKIVQKSEQATRETAALLEQHTDVMTTRLEGIVYTD